MDNFKKMIGEMKQAEQKEESTAIKPQPKVGAPAPKPQKPKNTIELNIFGNKPKTQQKLVNKATESPKNPVKEANVRAWVKKNYPTEFQTDNIRGDLTFDDLYKAQQAKPRERTETL